jgi:hypothetical protein
MFPALASVGEPLSARRPHLSNNTPWETREQSMRSRPRLRALAGIPVLGAVLAVALWLPLPTTGDGQQETVVDEVQERLPGWHVVRANPAWEGAYSVVAMCGGHELGFQLVPGHGLPVGDLWIQPDDNYAQNRLQQVSDHDVYLVWYEHPVGDRALSCGAELARTYPGERQSTPPDIRVSRAGNDPGAPRD